MAFAKMGSTFVWNWNGSKNWINYHYIYEPLLPALT
jgi:hypothetical protein